MSKIVLISPINPAMNPRLVKEADALADAGHEVVVLYSYRIDWAEREDKKIFAKNRWSAIQCGGNPTTSRLLYQKSRVIRKISSYLTFFDFFRKRSFTGAYGSLLRAAIKQKADLYIAHVLGAIPVAYKAAQINRSRYAFDAEDYHRGETSPNTKQYRDTVLLEDKYLSKTSYITAASPLIAEQYKTHYPQKHVIAINNVFPLKLQPSFKSLNHIEPLRFFWFSQLINSRVRGLTKFFDVLNQLQELKIELNLLGRVSIEEKKFIESHFVNPNHKVFFHPTTSEQGIINLASKHHFGLALEQQTTPNQNICLANKIFTYLLAGSYIVFSDTKAQSKFLKENPHCGMMLKGDTTKEFCKEIKNLYLNRNLLEQKRKGNWMLALSKFNWDKESKKLISTVEHILNDKNL